MAHDPTRRLLSAVPLLALLPKPATAATVPLPREGDRLALPDTTLLDGRPFKAADAAGKIVVIYWWASWCPFCALQSPEVQKLWERQRDHGLTVLGLSIDERIDDARRYLQQHRYTFPSGFAAAPEVRRMLPKPSKGLPVTCVLGRDGRVVMAEAGQLFPEDIEQIARFI